VFAAGAAIAAAVGGPTWLTAGYATLGAVVSGMASSDRRACRRERDRPPADPARAAPSDRAPTPSRASLSDHSPAPFFASVSDRAPGPARSARSDRVPGPSRAGNLWAGVGGPGGPADAGDRALGYVLVELATGDEFERHSARIKELCDAHELRLADVACDVAGEAGGERLRPGLTWALERMAAGEAQAFVVARLEHLTSAFAVPAQILRWFGERRLTLIATDFAQGLPGQFDPVEGGERSETVAGVGPRSWALESLRGQASPPARTYAGRPRAYEGAGRE
jgi:hypothetical protein